ncbi:CCD13 protein, partial [Acromyrmex insinuator]
YQLLCSEVGKNISISTLLSTPDDWRRAEQIRCLQQKLAELQSQKELSLSDRKNLTCLRNAEKERQQQIENIAKELRQAEVGRLKISEARYQDREVEVRNRELLRKKKNKCAKLESKLRDSEKERVGLAKVDMGYRTKSCMKSIQSFAIGIDVAATKPRYGDVTGTRDKVQRLHVNPRDIVRVKLAVSSPPRSSTVPLTSRRFSVCLNQLVYFCH